MALLPGGLVATLICFILVTLIRKYYRHSSYDKSRPQQSKNLSANGSSPYNSIVSLTSSFDWRTAAPLQLRPFKPQYHLTMNIKKSTISELVEVDQTYHERIMLRRHLLETQADAVLACNKTAVPAVLEFHRWMFGTYLPGRLPTMFIMSQMTAQDRKDASPALQNLVTGEKLDVNEADPIKALNNLGGHIDNDFLLLLPSSNDENGSPLYHLEAFITCFPNGFSTRSKLGLPLTAIHTPVPGYKEKLQRSMDRYFAKLAIGTVVKRANWSVTTHHRLFTESGNHLYKLDEAESAVASSDHADAEARRREYQEDIETQKQDVMSEDCRLRVERQTLHRLPESKAVLFGIRTYLYTLDEVKASGDGSTLADAIEGLSKGNVPDMMYYKRCVIWGDKVIEYLRNC